MNIKSAGVVTEGTPFIAKISAADVEGSTAPTDFEWTYENGSVEGSTRQLILETGNIYAVGGNYANLVKLDNTGTEQWNTGTDLDEYGQMNDLVFVNNEIYLVGHAYLTSIEGRMMKCDSSDGSMIWT